MNEVKTGTLRLRPIVQVPRRAQPGGKYLMTVDLDPIAAEDWPYPREEYSLTLILDTMPLFEHQPIGEPTLVVHRFGGTYGPARFLLEACAEECSGELRVTFLAESGLPLETIEIGDVHVKTDALVPSKEQATALSLIAEKEDSALFDGVSQPIGGEGLEQPYFLSSSPGVSVPLATVASVPSEQEVLWSGVDLLIRVEAEWLSKTANLVVGLSSPSGAASLSGTEDFRVALNGADSLRLDWLYEMEQFTRGFDVNLNPVLRKEVAQEANSIGRVLYDRLFTPELKKKYEGIRGSVHTVLLISDETWIPWEIVKPYGDTFEDNFLCLEFEMTRWLPGVAMPPPLKEVLSPWLVSAGFGTEPKSAGSEEAEAIEEFFGDFSGVHLRHLQNPGWDEVVDGLESEVDFFHYIGSGVDHAYEPGTSMLELHHRPLRARQLSGFLAKSLRRRRPFVFLNAPLVSAKGASDAGLGGWAKRWIQDAGASSFLAPTFDISDRSATTFSRAVYRGLGGGQGFGEACRRARREVLSSGRGFLFEVSALSYRCYGHPKGRVVFGSPLWVPRLEWLPHRSPPGALLRSEYGVVPFHFRVEELRDLDFWCGSPERLLIRLYTGPDGVGKTRLAAEVCRRRQREGWRVGFVDHERSAEETWRALEAIDTPRLLIVDYAEARQPLLVPLLKLIDDAKDENPIRVLLLARAALDWWEQLKSEGDGVGELLSGPATRWYTLQPLALSTEDRAESYKIAAEAFAGRLGESVPEELPGDLGAEHYKSALNLHMSALAAINGVEVKGEGGILDYLLDRQRQFWRVLAGKWELPKDVATGIGRAMAAITLSGGVGGEEKAVLAMRGLKFFKDEKESTLISVARLLREAYPGESRWIDPVMPDLLGEHLIMREMEKDSTELLNLVLGGEEDAKGEDPPVSG